MDSHMLDQIVLVAETFTTLSALSNLLFGVPFFMIYQIVFVFESEKTNDRLLSIKVNHWNLNDVSWLFVLSFVSYDLGQISHLNSRTSKWTIKCCCNRFLLKKSFPHWSQTSGPRAIKRKSKQNTINSIHIFHIKLWHIGSWMNALTAVGFEDFHFFLRIGCIQCMSPFCMIIIGWHIDKVMIALFTTIHFYTISHVHSFVYLMSKRIFENNFNEKICATLMFPHWKTTHFEGKRTRKFLAAYITKVVQVLTLMRCIVAFSSKSRRTILTLKSMWLRMYDHMFSQ